MAGDDKARPRPFRIETVQGGPYHVGGRTLTPVARIVSYGKAKGTIGTHRIGGWGFGLARVIPQAVLEKTDDGERAIAIVDVTAEALRGMFVTALAITVVFAALRWVVRRRHRAGPAETGE
jgi:hypothetical protein